MKLSIPRVVKGWRHGKLISPFTEFLPNGSETGRRFASQDEAPYWLEAFAEFGLTPVCLEPLFKNFTGNHFQDGAFVHPHTDFAPEGMAHTRCNLMIRKPNSGGNPIVDGEELEVDEGDLWLCIASMERHSSTPIYGGERLVFSFGGLVPVEQIMKVVQ